MFFCPKCNFQLDLLKSNVSENTIVVNSSKKFIELFTNDNLDNVDNLNFKLEELTKNKKYKKLSKSDKLLILEKFNLLNKITNVDVNFMCNNCNYKKKLDPNTIIFKSSFKNEKIDDLSLIKLRCNDNTLPRTKDFICINDKCKSNTKGHESKREAVLYRPFKNDYNLRYICCDCYSYWEP